MSAPERVPFQYVVVRIVPRVERGEYVNAGVVLHCPGRDWLGARLVLPDERVRALDPDVDVVAVEAGLASIRAAVDGDDAAQGLADPGARFRWLAAPRSAVVQPGPIHTGLTAAPATDLDRLYADLVA